MNQLHNNTSGNSDSPGIPAQSDNTGNNTGSNSRGQRTADYDYFLPTELIAQQPASPRDSSRLLILNRADESITHARFADIATLIPKGDALALNTSRVFRARLLGSRDSGAPAEIFLLRKLEDNSWEAMVHPGAKVKPGRTITIADSLAVLILAVTERHTRIVKLVSTLPDDEALEQHGHIPLPPYIVRSDTDSDATLYQTVYANTTGSVAAPTAGLHFTPQLLTQITNNGVTRVDLLLHVGAGTFRPVSVDDPTQHVMHEEWCQLSPEAALALNNTRNNNGKIWAVGTTSVRTLETAASTDGHFRTTNTSTDIFIRPPYHFHGVDHLITNFHLPRSTLIMLVAAFAGYDLTMHAYNTAVKEGYRFYSYGDAMCII